MVNNYSSENQYESFYKWLMSFPSDTAYLNRFKS